MAIEGFTASRRGVLAGAGGGLAALQFGLAGAQAANRPDATAPLFLFDTSIEGAADAAKIAADAGIDTASFRHDIGQPWVDVIAPAWRRSPMPVAGITYGGAFFCLDHLARSHGLACTARSAVAAGRDIAPAAAALLRLAAASYPATVPAHAAEYGDSPVLWLLQPIRSTL